MSRILLIPIAIMLLLGAGSARAADDGIDWLVAPYGWLPDISLTQSVPGDDGGDISGSDLLEKTDAAGMIRIEAAKNRWGVMLDYIFLALSDSTTLSLPGPSETPVNIDAELDLSVLEAGGVYRLSGAETGAHLLFGYRGIRAETTLLVTPGNQVTQRVDTDETLADVFFGARYLYRHGNWDVTVRGDYSVGESDGVLNLLGSVGYRFPGPFALQAGYRHAVLEYEATTGEGEPNPTELELSGPFLGFVFRF